MSPNNKKKLIVLRKKLDLLDNQLIKILKKRFNVVQNVLKLKEKKSEIIDRKRINVILNNIKKKYSAFDNNKMKNIYDSKKYFSPWVIICRGNKLNLDRDLNNIFHTFVNNYLNIYKLNPVNQFLNA